MDSAAVSHADPMVKGNKSSESEMDSAAVSHADPMVKGNKSSESEEKTVIKHFTPMSFEFEFDESDEVRRSYNPLSFYTSSTVYRPAPISAVNKFFQSKMMANEKKVSRNYIPLSYFTGGSTVYRKSSESKTVANEKKVSKNCIKGSSTKVNKSSESKVSRNSIPDKVFFSILSKLPIKSLKRFGCVCKSWSVLFENSDFMTMYSNHFISRHGSDDHYHTFLLTSCVDLSLTPDCFYNSEFHLLCKTLKFNPCHLICILGSTSVNGIFCFGQEYHIRMSCNMYCGILLLRNSGSFLLASMNVNYTTLETTSFWNMLFMGLVMTKLENDFKVVQFVSFNYDGMPSLPSKSFFEIYSLKSNSWRMINMKIDLCNCLLVAEFMWMECVIGWL